MSTTRSGMSSVASTTGDSPAASHIVSASFVAGSISGALRVVRWVRDARFLEALPAQQAAIAAATGTAPLVRVVTRVRQPVVHDQPRAHTDDVRLRHPREGR